MTDGPTITLSGAAGHPARRVACTHPVRHTARILAVRRAMRLTWRPLDDGRASLQATLRQHGMPARPLQ